MDHSDPVANTLSSSAEPQNGGTTKTDGGAVAIAQGDPYFSQVRSKIQSQIHYTPVMARWRLQGQVQIALTLLSDGSIASLNIQKSSGSAELDQQALNSVRAAIPFPSFSSTAPARKLELPIDFRLN
jgi:protein TonB